MRPAAEGFLGTATCARPRKRLCHSPVNIFTKSALDMLITTSAVTGGFPEPALPPLVFRSMYQVPPSSPGQTAKRGDKAAKSAVPSPSLPAGWPLPLHSEHLHNAAGAGGARPGVTARPAACAPAQPASGRRPKHHASGARAERPQGRSLLTELVLAGAFSTTLPAPVPTVTPTPCHRASPAAKPARRRQERQQLLRLPKSAPRRSITEHRTRGGLSRDQLEKGSASV